MTFQRTPGVKVLINLTKMIETNFKKCGLSIKCLPFQLRKLSIHINFPKFNYSNKFWFSDFAQAVLGFLYPFLEPS